jgi:N-methylhydantoinase B/oxoprolinase/acetone carboxylase alpha subunit
MYISVPPDYFANKLNEDFPDAKNYRSFLDINLLNSPEDKLSPIFNRKIEKGTVFHIETPGGGGFGSV